MSSNEPRVPFNRLKSTKGLHGRARRYACDPEMEPLKLLADEDLTELARMLDETKRLGLVAFELSRASRREEVASTVKSFRFSRISKYVRRMISYVERQVASELAIALLAFLAMGILVSCMMCC